MTNTILPTPVAASTHGRLGRELTPLLEVLAIDGDGRIEIGGRPAAAVDPQAYGEAPSSDPAVAREQQLTYAIYANFHCRAPREEHPTSGADSAAAPDWERRIAGYRAANCGQDTWDPGWTVEGVDGDGAVRLAKGDRRRRELPGRFAASDPSRPWLVVGDAVSVATPAESTTVQPGFYFVLGPRPASLDEEQRIARVYFNLTADGAEPWIASVSARLRRAGIPFRSKVVVDERGFGRTDAAVLYLARRHFEACLSVLHEVAGDVGAWLEERTPPFCMRLSPGVAVAEDPGESFGIHRARLVARGLLAARAQVPDGPIPFRLAEVAVAEAFMAAGIDPERPYLQPGNTDRYADHEYHA